MSRIILGEHQTEAIKKMKNGCILCGGVGTGKSRTALGYYYFIECQGRKPVNGIGVDSYMKTPKDLYIITTAKKRDAKDWFDESIMYDITSDPKLNECEIEMVVDSWNNIKKYETVKDSFFIFDEQRLVGYGAWVKAFLKIAKNNHWVLLTATPGDTWSDYIPVFIANGFYKNKTDFVTQHIVYSRFSKYPKVEKYINTRKLINEKEDILIPMHYEKQTVQHHLDVYTNYDKNLWKEVYVNRWNPYDNEPVNESGKLCYLLRRVVNDDKSRIDAIDDILKDYRKAIIFYNYTYELEALRKYCNENNLVYSEWNGERHQDIPNGNDWVYLVQYTAGCEGWNCITCNCIIFYSQNYSYRVMEQAIGRIDRLNTPYTDLFYYHLRSMSPIDRAIFMSLKKKKKFNELTFVKKIDSVRNS